MPLHRPSTRTLGRVLLPLLLLANVLMLLHYIGIDYRLIINSDSAAKNLLAQEIIESGSYFPPEWNYVNKDLWVYFTHTLVLPWLAFLPNSFMAHALAGVLNAALVLAGAWLLTGVLELRRPVRLVCMLVLSGGMSTNMAENIFGQGAYGTLFYLGCFLLYAYWRGTHASGRARLGWAAAVAGLAILLCWANPQRAAVFFILPLLAAGTTMLWSDVQHARALGRRPALRHAAWMALCLAGCAAGSALYLHTLRSVNSTTGLTALAWLDFSDMAARALGALRGVLSMLEGLPPPGTPMLSPVGVFYAARLAGALALVALLPWAVQRAMLSARPATRFVAVYTACGLALSLYITLTTGVIDMSSPESSMRYLAPGLVCALFLLVAVLAQPRAAGPLRRVAGTYGVLLLVLSAPYAYSTFYFRGYFPTQAEKADTAEGRAMDALRQRGLHYGYASFWNAGRITLLSGQDIKTRQVNFADGLLTPMRHLSSNRWYWPEAWQGPTFLLLAKTEAAQLQEDKLFALTGAPSEVFDHHEWRVWVFPHNIARDLAWDARYQQPASFAIDERTPHAVGQAQGGSLRAAPGESGALLYGPWISAERGHYEVRFDIETAGAAPDFGRVDIVADGGKSVLAQQALAGSGRRAVTLAFHAPRRMEQLEFRAISNGAGHLTIHGVQLQRAAPSKE